MTTEDAARVLEAILLCSQVPLSAADLARALGDEVGVDEVEPVLRHLQQQWSGKGMQLVWVAGGWRFQSAPDIRFFLDRMHPEKPPRYTRATLETLAIIAYRQPVTRGDIEAIRGVAVHAPAIKQLEDRGWIEVVGHRDTVGRPALFGTTPRFLADLGLRTLSDLPVLGPVQAGEPVESVLLGRTEPEAGSPTSDAVVSATPPGGTAELF